MQATTSIEILKPIEEVFTFVVDFYKMDRWITGVSDVQAISEGTIGEGTAFSSTYSYQGRVSTMNYRVKTYNAPTTYALEATSGPFPFHNSIELESTGTGTRVTYMVSAGSDSNATSVTFKLFGRLIRKLMQKHLHKDLVKLKSLVESK